MARSSVSSKISSHSQWLISMKIHSFVVAGGFLSLTFAAFAQQGQPQIGIAPVALSTGPYTFDTAEQHKIRVVPVVRGLVHRVDGWQNRRAASGRIG